MLKTVKYFYEKNYYTKENVGVFVRAGSLTSAEYKSITGDEYAA